jgi:dishevelled associated activator of morphogenesis
MRSRRVKKLLELVLALGNYMNRGQRGNARGFAIISLNNMVDTKSGVNKQVTLLHYLVETVEKRVNYYTISKQYYNSYMT